MGPFAVRSISSRVIKHHCAGCGHAAGADLEPGCQGIASHVDQAVGVVATEPEVEALKGSTQTSRLAWIAVLRLAPPLATTPLFPSAV